MSIGEGGTDRFPHCMWALSRDVPRAIESHLGRDFFGLRSAQIVAEVGEVVRRASGNGAENLPQILFIDPLNQRESPET